MEANSLEGFVQYVASNLLPSGYWFYVAGSIPEDKDAATIDAKLKAKFRADLSRSSKARRKRAGQANHAYIRWQRFFLILSTHGVSAAFFEDEASRVRDARKHPIKVAGYSISFRGGHASVRIEPNEYRCLKAHLLDQAVKNSLDRLVHDFEGLPFEPYAPVRSQLLSLWRHVNRARKAAGLSQVPRWAVRKKRRIVKVAC
jgi:hypothetical protein